MELITRKTKIKSVKRINVFEEFKEFKEYLIPFTGIYGKLVDQCSLKRLE